MKLITMITCQCVQVPRRLRKVNAQSAMFRCRKLRTSSEPLHQITIGSLSQDARLCDGDVGMATGKQMYLKINGSRPNPFVCHTIPHTLQSPRAASKTSSSQCDCLKRATLSCCYMLLSLCRGFDKFWLLHVATFSRLEPLNLQLDRCLIAQACIASSPGHGWKQPWIG